METSKNYKRSDNNSDDDYITQSSSIDGYENLSETEDNVELEGLRKIEKEKKCKKELNIIIKDESDEIKGISNETIVNVENIDNDKWVRDRFDDNKGRNNYGGQKNYSGQKSYGGYKKYNRFESNSPNVYRNPDEDIKKIEELVKNCNISSGINKKKIEIKVTDITPKNKSNSLDIKKDSIIDKELVNTDKKISEKNVDIKSSTVTTKNYNENSYVYAERGRRFPYRQRGFRPRINNNSPQVHQQGRYLQYPNYTYDQNYMPTVPPPFVPQDYNFNYREMNYQQYVNDAGIYGVANPNYSTGGYYDPSLGTGGQMYYPTVYYPSSRQINSYGPIVPSSPNDGNYSLGRRDYMGNDGYTYGMYFESYNG